MVEGRSVPSMVKEGYFEAFFGFHLQKNPTHLDLGLFFLVFGVPAGSSQGGGSCLDPHTQGPNFSRLAAPLPGILKDTPALVLVASVGNVYTMTSGRFGSIGHPHMGPGPLQSGLRSTALDVSIENRPLKRTQARTPFHRFPLARSTLHVAWEVLTVKDRSASRLCNGLA